MTEERIKPLEEELAEAKIRETELLHRCDRLEAELATLKEAYGLALLDLDETKNALSAAKLRREAAEATSAALKDAARPVVEDWTENRGAALDTSTDKEVGYVVATFEQLDTLAALVGEE